MGGQAKARRTNPLTTTRARLDFQTTATDDRVCPDQQRRTASACSICASLPLSLPTKAVHTMVFQGTSTPSIPPSIHPARISSQPLRLPETSSAPAKSATAGPDGNVESRLPFFSPQPLLSWPAHHDVTGPFDGLLGEA